MTRYSARTTAEARKTVNYLHTLIARGAARIMSTDHRITPHGAVLAMTEGLFARLDAERPNVSVTYLRALATLGLTPREMTYGKFLHYVDRDVALMLVTDRKVAGPRA